MIRSLKWIAPLMIIIMLFSATSVYAGWGDDNDSDYPEVGGEWINTYQPLARNLYHSDDNVQDIITRLQNAGWTKGYEWSEYMAWEEDFKEASSGGSDFVIVDTVDLGMFAGHGNGGALMFSDMTHDDNQLNSWDGVSWGDQDLEWMFLFACETLSDPSWIGWYYYAMQGLHLICGAVTELDGTPDGANVANSLVDDGWWDYPQTVKNSWFIGLDYYQSNGVQLRVLGENSDNGNDYIWKQGYVSSDPIHDYYYAIWNYTC